MLNNNIPESLSWGNNDFDLKPNFKVGDFRILGNPNVYDIKAKKVGAHPSSGNLIYPVLSGFKKIVILDVEKRYHPKDGSGINSWLTHGDYSNNPNFDVYWWVNYDEEDLFYELADLLYIAS